MTPFERFFDGNFFVINLARRPDRMAHFNAEMKHIGVTCVERFEAVDAGIGWGNNGCSASHRAVMELIIARGLRRAFIFEDDAVVRSEFRDRFHDQFAVVEREIPEDFSMMYLGAGYGEKPQGWVSKHIIRTAQMKTTSSYGVTGKSAPILRDLIPVGTTDSIDNLYAGFNVTGKCYICEPRLFIQYHSFSDLQQNMANNGPSMEDQNHVLMLGKFRP